MTRTGRVVRAGRRTKVFPRSRWSKQSTPCAASAGSAATTRGRMYRSGVGRNRPQPILVIGLVGERRCWRSKALQRAEPHGCQTRPADRKQRRLSLFLRRPTRAPCGKAILGSNRDLSRVKPAPCSSPVAAGRSSGVVEPAAVCYDPLISVSISHGSRMTAFVGVRSQRTQSWSYRAP